MMLVNWKGDRAAAALSAAMAMLAAVPCPAASVRVNPVNVVLPPDRGTAELSVTNSDRRPVSMRVSAVRWTQRDGRDVYEPAPEVIASPPIFTVAAGGSQLVRLGLRSRTSGAAYRIQVEEIPPPAVAGTGIRVALKLDLPFYVLATREGKPELSWSVEREEAGMMIVAARNDGNRHGRVLGVELVDASGRTLAASGASGVVLPKSMRNWRLRAIAQGAPVAFMVSTPTGKVRSELHAARP